MKIAIASSALIAMIAAPAFAQSSKLNPTAQMEVQEETVAQTVAAPLIMASATVQDGLREHQSPACCTKDLELSDQQLEKIYTLKNKLFESVAPKQLELKEQRGKLRDILSQKSLDRALATQVQQRINELIADISNLALSFNMDLSDQFTSDQKEKLRHKFLLRSVARGVKGKFARLQRAS